MVTSPSHFDTNTLPSHNPPNTQTIRKASTTKDLGIVLNTRLSAEDNVVNAVNKARRNPFYLKRSFAALTPSICLPLYKRFTRPHLEYTIQATYPAMQRHWKRCRGVCSVIIAMSLCFASNDTCITSCDNIDNSQWR